MPYGRGRPEPVRRIAENNSQINPSTWLRTGLGAKIKTSGEDFGLSIFSPDEQKLCSSGIENLKNMAVIESAYLSARTGLVEELGRILRTFLSRARTPINI